MKIILHNKEVEIDDDCVNLVKFFNGIGLTTEFCCSGHGKGNFWILFNNSVSDSQIEEFLEKNSNKNCSLFLGQFSKWLRKLDEKMTYTWEYRAESIYFAQEDFRRMEVWCNGSTAVS